MSDEPPILPNHQISAHGSTRPDRYRVSAHDRDDFVRNLLTVLDADPSCYPHGMLAEGGAREIPLSPSASSREPVVDLAQIKRHCHIEPEQTVDDQELILLEQAAHIHAEQVLRRPGGLDATAPENIKLAVLVLVGHWYRNREAVADGVMSVVPMTFEALISTEREYSGCY